MKEARALSEMQKRMNRRGFGVASENYADEAMGIVDKLTALDLEFAAKLLVG